MLEFGASAAVVKNLLHIGPSGRQQAKHRLNPLYKTPSWGEFTRDEATLLIHGLENVWISTFLA
jgi:hypothetical protein